MGKRKRARSASRKKNLPIPRKRRLQSGPSGKEEGEVDKELKGGERKHVALSFQGEKKRYYSFFALVIRTPGRGRGVFIPRENISLKGEGLAGFCRHQNARGDIRFEKKKSWSFSRRRGAFFHRKATANTPTLDLALERRGQAARERGGSPSERKKKKRKKKTFLVVKKRSEKDLAARMAGRGRGGLKEGGRYSEKCRRNGQRSFIEPEPRKRTLAGRIGGDSLFGGEQSL